MQNVNDVTTKISITSAAPPLERQHVGLFHLRAQSFQICTSLTTSDASSYGLKRTSYRANLQGADQLYITISSLFDHLWIQSPAPAHSRRCCLRLHFSEQDVPFSTERINALAESKRHRLIGERFRLVALPKSIYHAIGRFLRA